MAELENKRDNPGLPLPPPAIFAIVLALSFVLDPLFPLRFLSREAFWQAGMGFVLALAAVGIALWALGEFRRAETHVDPRKPVTHVVTTGPYGLLRNPMYVGFLLLQAGASLVLSLEWGLLLVPVLWLGLHMLAVGREERYLSAKFGKVYEDYRGRVRRWGLF